MVGREREGKRNSAEVVAEAVELYAFMEEQKERVLRGWETDSKSKEATMSEKIDKALRKMKRLLSPKEIAELTGLHPQEGSS
jgi:ElaB/YqjD/DUF883 family membrane-anchored ribosome-binding protein